MKISSINKNFLIYFNENIYIMNHKIKFLNKNKYKIERNDLTWKKNKVSV